MGLLAFGVVFFLAPAPARENAIATALELRLEPSSVRHRPPGLVHLMPVTSPPPEPALTASSTCGVAPACLLTGGCTRGLLLCIADLLRLYKAG